MSDLLCLPAPLILGVGEYLGDKDLAHLANVNHFLSQLLSRTLLTRSFEDKPRVVNINALTWAIEHGHTNLVRSIVSQPRFQPARVKNALNEAAELGDCDMISILLGAGYPLNSPYTQQQPLHCSAQNGHPEATKLLLDSGASSNAKDNNGETAFSMALMSPPHIFRHARKKVAACGELELIRDIDRRVASTLKILVENGAAEELFVVDEYGQTLLHIATSVCLSCEEDLSVGAGVLRFLVNQGASLSAPCDANFRPVDCAAMIYGSGNCNALNFFLDLGVSPNSKDPAGRSLLSNAVCCDKRALPIVEFLLKRGAIADDLDLLDYFTDTRNLSPEPLTFDRIITLLLIHGASFGDNGSKCFTIAAIDGCLEAMKTVFDTGRVNINTPFRKRVSGRMKTPLQVAIKAERTDMLEFLVTNGVKMSRNQKKLVQEMLGKA